MSTVYVKAPYKCYKSEMQIRIFHFLNKSNLRDSRFIKVIIKYTLLVRGGVVMVKALEFKLQSHYYVHFRTLGKVWNPLSSQLGVK